MSAAKRKPIESGPKLTIFRGEQLASDGPQAAEVGSPVATNQPPHEVQALLEAWHAATLRLEETHATLTGEVTRLTQELEVKNRELARKNRLADLGRMASHVAHEVRNSLVPVQLYMSLVRRRLENDRQGLDALGKVEASLSALDSTVNDLLTFTSQREPRPTGFVVGDLIDEVCESVAPQLAAQDIDIDLDVPPHVSVIADRELIRRALLNLMLNAIDAMPTGGELVITVFSSRGAVEIEIADSGEGLSAEQERRAFEPFYTTKETGTGLGLSVVCHIAEAHGGSITAANCPEGGAAFTLRLPRNSLQAAA